MPSFFRSALPVRLSLRSPLRPACRLGVPLAKVAITKNAAGESTVKMLESVREFDVYIINTGCGEINTS